MTIASLVNPWPATIATITVLSLIMALPMTIYLRIILSFVCNKQLQTILKSEEDFKEDETNASQPPPLALLSFSNLSYTVKKTQHEIVKNVSGWFSPRTLSAILGSSGCGKTTLLSILANNIDSSGVCSGTVSINSKNIHSIKNYRSICAYVLQSDNLMERLTTREFLWFSAELRLDKNLKQEEKLKIVQKILKDLDLSHVATNYIHLLSGGQKRRLTVACELVSQPSCLMLDEPTSGLDASGSLKLVKVLRKLADSGPTIICTIHQPRIDAFQLFHMMILMDSGRFLYFGPITKVFEYFEAKNLQEENPADFVLDLIHEMEADFLADKFSKSELCKNVISTVYQISISTSGDFFSFTQDLDWFPEKQFVPKEILQSEQVKDKLNLDCFGWQYIFSYSSSLLKQQFTLIRRAMLNEYRNQSYFMTWVLGIIMMLFMGMLYCFVTTPVFDSQQISLVTENLETWQACTQNFSQLSLILSKNSSSVDSILNQCGFDLNQSLQLALARSSLLYQLLASMFFSEMPMIPLMFNDRQLYIREHSSRAYSTSAWILSWVCKFTFTGFLKGLIFPPFVYFSAQLPIYAEPYFLFSIFMGIMSIAGSTFALLCVVLFKSPESASVAFVLLNVVSQNLSGYFIQEDFIPWWFRWIFFMNFFHYTYGGIISSQFLTLESFNYYKATNNLQLYYQNELDSWVFALVAIGLCLIFQFVSFFVLALQAENQFKRKSGTCCYC